jgi:hypothetical protein
MILIPLTSILSLGGERSKRAVLSLHVGREKSANP